MRLENETFIIIRPTIIGCSLIFPSPGWTDNEFAASSIMILSGLGVVTIQHGYNDIIGDLIPVDMVSNSMIVLIKNNYDKKIFKVYNYGSSFKNPLYW
jgi:hypothetical protein